MWFQTVPRDAVAMAWQENSDSCRCAIVGVPWGLRRLSIFSTRLKQRLEDKITPG